ncbi:hypothetical protein AKJ16_DCAP00655 [Drosera capensis]
MLYSVTLTNVSSSSPYSSAKSFSRLRRLKRVVQVFALQVIALVSKKLVMWVYQNMMKA